jgi:hypothetical protein
MHALCCVPRAGRGKGTRTVWSNKAARTRKSEVQGPTRMAGSGRAEGGKSEVQGPDLHRRGNEVDILADASVHAVPAHLQRPSSSQSAAPGQIDCSGRPRNSRP